MALVASHDWSNDMDGTRQQQQQQQQRTHPNTSDSQNISNGVPQQQQQLQQQQQSPTAYAQGPYGFAHPQQASPAWHMGGMSQMNLPHGQPAGYFPQMQFYPQHYPQQQHPQQLPYGQPAPHMFDPNAHFAQWAYQQMMFNAQQQQQQQQQQSHQMSLPQQPPQQGGGRGRSASATTSNAGTPTNEYYQTPYSGHGRFQQSSPSTGQQSGAGGQYQGFHPYRRPDRGERRPHNDNNHASSNNSIPFQPPYARSDATGSSTSVNSSSSTSHRSRTNSGTNASGSAGARPAFNQQNSSGSVKHTPRQASTSSSITTTTSTSIGPRSSSSSSSTLPSSPLSSSPIATSPAPRTSRPSPLSQGSILSAAERRKSRDDSDLAAMFNSAVNLNDSSPATPTTTPRSGLKGRLRRALSLGAATTLREEEEENTSKVNGKKKEEPIDGDSPDGASMATKKTKKSLRMFNSRFNASTDNISLSSTVSSASVMIRKLGSMGKLARRNSLAGITSLFKDKDKNKDGGGEDAGEVSDSKGKKAKGKAKKADASVTLATAEVDKSNEWSGPGMEGLSPAAKLARQHTLKSNAEAAARAKAQQEAQAASAAAAAVAATSTPNGVNGEMLPTTWERNTATRHGANLAGGSAQEDGMRVVVEEDSDEGEGEENGDMMKHKMDEFLNSSDDDSTWHGHEEEDEDATVRLGQRPAVIDEDGLNNGHGHADDDDDVLDEPWAVNCRRSVERNLKPTRGILKKTDTVNYQTGEQPIGPNAAFMQRSRANSYDSVPSHQTERGPLAHGPPTDPDAMDKLRRHNSARSTNSAGKENNATGTNNGGGPPLLPPLHFDSTQGAGFAPALSTSHSQDSSEKRSSVFNHPGLNNSEPALSTMLSSPPTLSHRSATTPAKRLAFAANLSIYDTFSSSTYDRRSEPATWSRLTPALAQRIKEELNSYKMEEMEVHAASRIHTQFHI